MQELRIVQSTPDHAFGWVPGAALYVWRGATTAAAAATMGEMEGFQASMVRMVAAGLALLARAPFPHQVFADVATAAAWLEERLGGDASPHRAAELQAHMATLRAAARA